MLSGLTKRARAAQGEEPRGLDGRLRALAGGVRRRDGRAALLPHPGPRHLLFAFCDHYEPLWKNQDWDRGAERVRAWQHGYPALAGPVPRRRRAAAAPLLLLPRRGVRARLPRRARQPGAPRARRGRAAPAPRRRHRRRRCARSIDDYLAPLRRARPPLARPRRAPALRVHPRQLVPRQRAPRRPLVRRRRGAAAAARHRLLRRLHVPVGARRVAAAASSTRSTGPRAIWRGAARYDTGDAGARSARCGAIAS